MKKLVFVFSAVLFVFAACRLFEQEDRGILVVDFGSSSAARSVDASGLPMPGTVGVKTIVSVFDLNNSPIDQKELTAGETSASFRLPVGKTIRVRVKIHTAASSWSGESEYTVSGGINNLALKLSKKAAGFANFLFCRVFDGNTKFNLRLDGMNSRLLDSEPLGSSGPVFTRDNAGRTYCIYSDSSFVSHFKRWDCEGKPDTAFESLITNAGTSFKNFLNSVAAISADPVTGAVYILNGELTGSPVYRISKDVTGKEIIQGPVNLGVSSRPQVLAVYKDTLFIVKKGNSFKLQALAITESGSSFTFSSKAEIDFKPVNLPPEASPMATDIYVDKGNTLYCLFMFNQENPSVFGSALVPAGSIGGAAKFDWNGTSFEQKGVYGCNTAPASVKNMIKTEADKEFYGPIKFIGQEGRFLYIADDGFKLEYENEKPRIKENVNRIVKFNMDTQKLVFADASDANMDPDGSMWMNQSLEWKSPESKILLWEKDTASGGMKYWLGDNGSEPFSVAFIQGSTSADPKPTDVFCYDQDGNLYVVWVHNGDHSVRRYMLKADGSYDTAGMKEQTLYEGTTPLKLLPAAIAADISELNNLVLYYGIPKTTAAVPANAKIRKFVFSNDYMFDANDSSKHTDFLATLAINENVSALAANKDGVFVGVKTAASTYGIEVRKYNRTGAANGSAVIVPSGTSVAGYINENLSALLIQAGTLYGISFKCIGPDDGIVGSGSPTSAIVSSKLYKLANTEAVLGGTGQVILSKESDSPNMMGYGFYRFTAVKPKKIYIASDGFYGYDDVGTKKTIQNDQVIIFDLEAGSGSAIEAKAKFSKELAWSTSGFFEWK